MDSCANLSRHLAEPLQATAATARTWLLVEQPGPWGARAVTSSHLDRAVGRALEERADGTGVRVALIRRPGPHADRHQPQRRRIFLSHTAPGASWVRASSTTSPVELLDLDFAKLGAGDHGGFGAAYEGEPLALVCTNGRRDRCCAILGRPLAAELAGTGGCEVWEITHLGGHRFSPTMLVLPYGYTYGRVDARAAKEILDAARDSRMVVSGCRGRSAWERPGQAAELAVRELISEDRAEAVAVAAINAVEGAGAGNAWSMEVRHADGRIWTVGVREDSSAPPRPESCGAPLGTPVRMVVSSFETLGD